MFGSAKASHYRLHCDTLHLFGLFFSKYAAVFDIRYTYSDTDADTVCVKKNRYVRGSVIWVCVESVVSVAVFVVLCSFVVCLHACLPSCNQHDRE